MKKIKKTEEERKYDRCVVVGNGFLITIICKKK
jgi:hypothetical protein